MCGGRGTRLDADCEKPLFPVGGEPMVARVVDALAASGVGTVHAAVSPHAPETRRFAEARDDLATVETPGEGYVADLGVALDAVETPALTVAADLPLLAADAVDAVLAAHDARTADAREPPSLTVCVPAALKRALGASTDATFERDGRELAPAGVNVVADTDTETMYETYDARFAVNVNRPSDADLAEALL
ncbi:NTP transferase domain-containing protein [Halorussus halobius]|uniref:NTP transferase domain-containing protein n=1 Tax=Halorussus halobius TaxID=1710537 RepID=UPI001FCE9CE6|nr:NTP transferase domain-containing protein [Halorussus halobius]